MTRTLVAALLLVTGVPAQVVPDGFVVDTLLTSGFGAASNAGGWGPSGPMDFCFLPDGRMIVAIKTGEIKLHLPGTTSFTLVGVMPALDITSARGLTGFCLDPAYPARPYLYAVSTRNDARIWVTRHTLTGDLSNPTSTNLALADQYDILDAPDNHIFHNSSPVRFGPDGMLYVALGDDNDPCACQDRTSLIGVLLRLDVSGLPAGAGGPPGLAALDPGDNPFSASGDLVERLVIAWGLRMPFSMDIDSVTGDIFIGDVGQSDREEIDWFPRNLGGPITPRNFGWPWREGTAAYTTCGPVPPNDLVDPIDDYHHSVGGVCIMLAGVLRTTGGPFDFGPAYELNVFHNDNANGTIERLVLDGGTGTWSNAPPVAGQPSPAYWGSGFPTAHRFDQGPDGALYFLQRTPAALRRIRPDPPANQVQLIAGDDQVGVLGGTFQGPVQVVVQTPAGAPLAGVTVTFAADASGAVASPSVVTDAAGLASTAVNATGSGPIQVTATTLNGAAGVANLFARGLSVSYSPGATEDLVTADLVNTSNGAVPVPFVFGFTLPAAPLIATPIGTLGIDLLTFVDTTVIEDGIGLFGGQVILGGLGTPGRTNVYPTPPGMLTGLVLRCQAGWLDPTVTTSIQGIANSPWALSNIVTVGF